MIYFFYGKKASEAREKANKTVASLVLKKPDAALFKIEAVDWNSGQVTEYAEGKGLFSEKYIVFLDNVFENKDAKDWLLTSSNLKIISESANIFVLLEKKIDKASLGKIEKAGGKTQEFEEKNVKEELFQKEKYNVFKITDAIGERNKKNAWTYYREAIDAGVPAEEICGSFFWHFKTMILTAKSSSSGEADMKPFVFNKNIRFSKNYSDDELMDRASELVSIYHNAHLGLLDFELALEKFVLSI